MEKQGIEIQKIQITIKDNESGKVLNEIVTNKALFLYDLTPDLEMMNINMISLGTKEQVVTLLNVAVVQCADKYLLQGFVHGSNHVPLFHLPNNEQETA